MKIPRWLRNLFFKPRVGIDYGAFEYKINVTPLELPSTVCLGYYECLSYLGHKKYLFKDLLHHTYHECTIEELVTMMNTIADEPSDFNGHMMADDTLIFFTPYVK